MRIERDGYKLIINDTFLNEFAEFTKSHIVDSFTKGTWDVPYPNSEFNLSGMGTSQHQAMSSAIEIKGFKGLSKKVGIFAKPFLNDFFYLAFQERDNIITARKRGINTPDWIAIISADDWSILITELKRNVRPLSAENMNFGLLDSRYFTPQDFLNEYISYIAFMHNQGFAHTDLHLGNIGDEYFEDKKRKKIVFDLETSVFLSKYDMICRQDGILNNKQKELIGFFERRSIEDIWYFCSKIAANKNFPMSYEQIVEEAIKLYFDKRQFNGLWGAPSVDDLRIRMSQPYRSI